MRYMLFLKHIGVKLLGILQTVQGWVVAGLLFLLDFIAGHELAVGLVVAVTLMDAAWGIMVSIHRRKFALSELARLTIGKLAVYGCAMLVFIGLDKMIGMALTSSVIGAAITLVELWSASASMLILFPNFLFLKLLRKALTGEIASKLGVEPEEVEKVLAGGEVAMQSQHVNNGTSSATDEQVKSARKRAYKPRKRKEF